MLVKIKWQNEPFFFQYIYSTHPPPQKIQIVEVLMGWVGMEWPIGLLDIVHKENLTFVLPVGYVLFQCV